MFLNVQTNLLNFGELSVIDGLSKSLKLGKALEFLQFRLCELPYHSSEVKFSVDDKGTGKIQPSICSHSLYQLWEFMLSFI